MAKTSENFPKDTCPISESRRLIASEYLQAKANLEVSELWAEAFEKVADKTFQIPYWKSFIQASLPSTDAAEITTVNGIQVWKDGVPGFSRKKVVGYKFSVQEPFIVPQISKHSPLFVIPKAQFKQLIEIAPEAAGKDSYFYQIIADLYSSAEIYLPWLSSNDREIIEEAFRKALVQLETQDLEETRVPAVFFTPFKNCGIFVIDDPEFNAEIESIKQYLLEAFETQEAFLIDTKSFPLYCNLWKRPRGKEWKALLHLTHGISKNIARSSAISKIKSTVMTHIFSEKQLERALEFLRDQYNPDWKSVLIAPHDGLAEEYTPAFWKRTKLFSEYLIWTDMLWNRLINGNAYKNRVQLTENFPEMATFTHCAFMASSTEVFGYSYSGLSCKVPYKFPRPVLMTGTSDQYGQINLASNTDGKALCKEIYGFDIGTVGWSQEDELIAGPYELFHDPLTVNILQNYKAKEIKYKQAMVTVCKAYKIAYYGEQTELTDHILKTLADFELDPAMLLRESFKSLY